MKLPTIHRSPLQKTERSLAHAAGALLIGGALMVALSLGLPHPDTDDTAAMIAIAIAMFVGGMLCWSLAALIPVKAIHLILATTVTLTGLLIYESGTAAGQYGVIFVWATLIVGCYFSRRIAALHLTWLLAMLAVVLATVGETGGYSPVTRWIFTAVSLSVVAAITTAIIAARTRADRRSRRFFELSRDMLATSNTEGYFVELNAAWEETLGYSEDELRSVPFVDLVHPDDREQTNAVAAGLFDGSDTIGFENRYRAKDGSWHWLRWSATVGEDESPIYARATDVTELRRIETEREKLLEEVEAMARSDALTGLPNRHVLDEQLPREMARGLRGEMSLCLAIVDLDHFKAYNDSRGHIAGDDLLRRCADAWSAEVRGGDTIIRFGGEEFLVLLPDCKLDRATAILERLLAATPGEQTCSAGVACWDTEEGVDALLERADASLYRAKGNGRNRIGSTDSPEPMGGTGLEPVTPSL